MADITKSYRIPDEHIAELVEVFGEEWPSTVDGKPNTQSKALFASEKFDEEIINHVKGRVVKYRRAQLLATLNKDNIIEVG